MLLGAVVLLMLYCFVCCLVGVILFCFLEIGGNMNVYNNRLTGCRYGVAKST